MEIREEMVMKNLGTFAHAYGLEANSNKLVEDIRNGNGYVESVGILLRDPATKKGLISCQFPANEDITDQMLWVPIDERPVEAVPIYTREVSTEMGLKTVWRKLKDKMTSDHYYLIQEGEFRLRVHQSFCKQGVIEKYIPKEGCGYIRRNRRGIYFFKEWCNLEQIAEGKEVSFVPIISRKGLQARAVEEVIS